MNATYVATYNCMNIKTKKKIKEKGWFHLCAIQQGYNLTYVALLKCKDSDGPQK